MRTGPVVGMIALIVCGPLACGGGGGGGSSTPTSPTSPVTPTSPATPTTPAAPVTVAVQNNSFTPTDVTVAAGSTVTWKWDTCTNGYDPYGNGTQTCVDHSIVWEGTNAAAASPTQSSGTYQRTFATAGTYSYHCAVHGAAMAGKVVVQ